MTLSLNRVYSLTAWEQVTLDTSVLNLLSHSNNIWILKWTCFSKYVQTANDGMHAFKPLMSYWLERFLTCRFKFTCAVRITQQWHDWCDIFFYYWMSDGLLMTTTEVWNMHHYTTLWSHLCIQNLIWACFAAPGLWFWINREMRLTSQGNTKGRKTGKRRRKQEGK